VRNGVGSVVEMGGRDLLISARDELEERGLDVIAMTLRV
jgi:hypothetical protein